MKTSTGQDVDGLLAGGFQDTTAMEGGGGGLLEGKHSVSQAPHQTLFQSASKDSSSGQNKDCLLCFVGSLSLFLVDLYFRFFFLLLLLFPLA